MPPLPHVECVIVGGGIVGVAAALELAQADFRCTILEHGDLGAGVTGASLAALAAHALARVEDLPVIAAAGRRWAELADHLEDDFEYRRQGQLRLISDADDGAGFASLVAEHRALGAPLEMLDADALAALEPALGPDAAWAAVLSPDDASVNALRAVHALAAAARGAGARIETGMPVRSIEQDGEGWTVRTPTGGIRADRVVVAAGPWTSHLVAPLGVALPLEARRARCAVSDRLPDLVGRIVSGVETGAGLGIGEGYFQIQQTRSGHLLFNTVVDGALSSPDDLHDQDVDDGFMAASARTLAHVIPASCATRFLRSWAAVEAWTPDRRFLCGPVDGLPGLYVAAGDSGSGFLRAPLLGQLLRDLMLGRKPVVDPEPFAPLRFAVAT